MMKKAEHDGDADLPEPATIIDALIDAVRGGGGRAAQRARVAAILADTRVESVRAGVAWVHHPIYPDSVISGGPRQ